MRERIYLSKAITGEHITELFLSAGLTNAEVARQFGLSPEYIGEIVHGHKAPPALISKILTLYGSAEAIYSFIDKQVAFYKQELSEMLFSELGSLSNGSGEKEVQECLNA